MGVVVVIEDRYSGNSNNSGSSRKNVSIVVHSGSYIVAVPQQWSYRRCTWSGGDPKRTPHGGQNARVDKTLAKLHVGRAWFV